MDSIRLNKLQELIYDGSPRVTFHPIIPYHRQPLHPLIKKQVQLVSYDTSIVTGLVVCKHCHQLFAIARWNNKIVFAHLHLVHKIAVAEEPFPKINSETSMVPIATCQAMEKHEEAKVIQLPEARIMDYADTYLKFGESSQMDQTNKKKRGRKPKPKVAGAPIVEKKKRGRKPKPKVEAVPLVEKKKRGRNPMGEKKIVPEKKMRVHKPKVSCESNSEGKTIGKVIAEVGAIKIVNF